MNKLIVLSLLAFFLFAFKAESYKKPEKSSHYLTADEIKQTQDIDALSSMDKLLVMEQITNHQKIKEVVFMNKYPSCGRQMSDADCADWTCGGTPYKCCRNCLVDGYPWACTECIGDSNPTIFIPGLK